MSRVFGVVRSPYTLEQVLKTGNSARDNHFTDVSNILFSDGGNYQNDTAIISNDITTLFMEINTLDSSVNLIETKLADPITIGISAGAGNVPPAPGCIAIGNTAGSDSQQANAIAVGTNAGLVQQGSEAIAIGYGSGGTQQGIYSIGIGAGAGGALQATQAIAIGLAAGAVFQGQDAIAIGSNSANGLQGQRAVAIGFQTAGASATGQGQDSVALGAYAGQTDGISDQPANSIAINATGAPLLPTGVSQTHIAPIREDNISGDYILQYNPTTSEIYRSNYSLNHPYGTWIQTTTSTVSADNVPTELSGYTLQSGFGIDVSTGTPSRFTVSESGTYIFNYSLQFDKSGGGTSAVDIWIRLNGTDVSDSASQITIQGTAGETIAFCEYTLELVAGDGIAIVFASADSTVAVTTFPAISSPYVRPRVPGAIINMRRIR
jgi:hypothetical protein